MVIVDGVVVDPHDREAAGGECTGLRGDEADALVSEWVRPAQVSPNPVEQLDRGAQGARRRARTAAWSLISGSFPVRTCPKIRTLHETGARIDPRRSYSVFWGS